MKNSILFICIVFISILCLGCEGKKKNDVEQIFENVRYHAIDENDFKFWDGLVEDSDFSNGPHGVRQSNVIITSETAAMVGEALIRSALSDKYVEESLKIVIDKSKYWVVQGTANSTKENVFYVFIAVIQKSNGKVLDFNILKK